VVSLQAELSYLHGHLAHMELPQPPPPPTATAAAAPVFSIADLPSATVAAVPATYDLSSLFDPMGQGSWAMQQRAMDPRQYMGAAPSTTTGAELQAVARDISHRHGSPPTPPASSSNASPSLSLSK
ncbi:LOB domain-containing protein 30, partial [Mucuna pruriens]